MGRMFSIAREISGGGALCQLPATFRCLVTLGECSVGCATASPSPGPPSFYNKNGLWPLSLYGSWKRARDLERILSIIAVAAAADGDNETEWTPLNLYLAPSEEVRVVCRLYQVRHEKNKNRRRRRWELCKFAHPGNKFLSQ